MHKFTSLLMLLTSLLQSYAASLPGAIYAAPSTSENAARTTAITISPPPSAQGVGTNINTGSIVVSNLTASVPVEADASKKLVSGTVTGTGAFVKDTSPTIVTPTIASFANANHNHQDSAGGGQLSATSVFSGGTVPTARLGSGTANSSTFLRGDQTWATPAGSGDFVGPSSSTDNAIVRFDGTTGKLGQNSGVTIDDSNNLSVPGSVSAGASSGVSMTGSNGTLTILGAGDGQDEDFKIDLNGTANTVVITSTTGVTAWDFGTIDVKTDTLDLTGTGTINGLDAIDSTTETTLESALDIGGEVTSTGMGSTVIGDSITVATWTMTGTLGLTVNNGATSAGAIGFKEDSDNGSNTATLIGPASTADVTITLPAATDTLVGKATTDTLTGKTYDAAGTGNVLGFTSYQDFVFPSRVDGSGTTIVTNDYTSGLWGLATSNGTADTNGNYAIFRVGTVPYDNDTATEWVLKGFSIRVSGTDTDAAQFTIALWSPASSSSYTPTDFTSLSTFINFDSGTLTSPAANDIFYFSDVTLTGWAAAVTAGRPLIIGIARRNGSNDDSVTIVSGTIASKRTQ